MMEDICPSDSELFFKAVNMMISHFISSIQLYYKRQNSKIQILIEN